MNASQINELEQNNQTRLNAADLAVCCINGAGSGALSWAGFYNRQSQTTRANSKTRRRRITKSRFTKRQSERHLGEVSLERLHTDDSLGIISTGMHMIEYHIWMLG